MLSPDAMAVLKARYLRENETPDEMFRRVAGYVAQAEADYGQDVSKAAEEYYSLMAELAFLPNSPTLINAGKPGAQLAACFVLPIEDSLAGIFETLKNTALIHQSGGGTGFSFSRLRPKGDKVAGTGNVSSGPVSFMHIYDKAAQIVKQGAVRSGANMAVLRVDHPDIMDFITAKAQPDVLNNFNLSVGITEEFISAVTADNMFSLINPRNGQVIATIAAREIFDRLVYMAWTNGEPGLFFLDTVNRANPTPELGVFESPNPCSEQPLLPYESCTLGSVNLVKMLMNQGTERHIDYDKLRYTVRTAVRFLDDVIHVNTYPLPIVAETTRRTRKIGLGIMGLAEIFILLNIPYASQTAVDLTAGIMRFISAEARLMSRELAMQRGSFPAFPGSSFSRQGYALMRNATVTTIAPTGSISMIAGCSSGIEPLFALSLTRRVLNGQQLTSVNNVALAYLEERKLLSEEILKAIDSTGKIAETGLAGQAKQVLATAHEIEPFWHVCHLAAAQRYTDNGVSKTVNMPNNATTDDVAKIFFQAFSSGCKGVTVYRDASRDQQVLTSGGNCAKCAES